MITFKVTRMQEDTLALFGKHPETTGDLLVFLEKHFGKLPEGFVAIGGLLTNLQMRGDDALKWWSDNVSRYVHEEDPESKAEKVSDKWFFLTEGEDGKPLPAPDATL